jgi:hypothetical protein
VAAVSAAFDRMPPLAESAALDSPERALRASWAALTDLLALGPEPALRDCPSCGKSGMRNASVCGFCWAKLTPPAHHDAVG